MRIGILCTGDELLKGAVLDTNSAYMGKRLLEGGLIPEKVLRVADEPGKVISAVRSLLEELDLIILSGGLGPTADDLTKESVAELFGKTLVENEEAVKAISSRWDSMKRGPMPFHFLKQALIPEGAEMLPNNWGTAPGIWMTAENDSPYAGKHIVMLPGPPRELEPMFDTHVLPRIRERQKRRLASKLFHIAGVGESKVEERMQSFLKEEPSMGVAYCASPEFVKLFLTTEDTALLEKGIAFVRKEFYNELLSDEVKSVAEDVLFLMEKEGLSLATAESCTGGLVSAELTAIPGSSASFRGGIVCYDNGIKRDLLGVKEETLSAFGAVSKECIKELLEGIRKNFKTPCGIAISGIAGPGGGTATKKVGYVCIGVYCRDQVMVGDWNFRGSREQVRARSVAVALNTLRCMIKDVPIPESLFRCPGSGVTKG